MSSDNYLYVRKARGDKWAVTMEFASDDPRPVPDYVPLYDTRAQALEAAADWEHREPYLEYGIQVEREKTARDTRLEQIRKLVEEEGPKRGLAPDQIWHLIREDIPWLLEQLYQARQSYD